MGAHSLSSGLNTHLTTAPPFLWALASSASSAGCSSPHGWSTYACRAALHCGPSWASPAALPQTVPPSPSVGLVLSLRRLARSSGALCLFPSSRLLPLPRQSPLQKQSLCSRKRRAVLGRQLHNPLVDNVVRDRMPPDYCSKSRVHVW